MKKSNASIQLASILLIAFSLHNLAQAQSCDSNKPETTPTSRFEINQADGTAFDTKTKLTWKMCAEGQSYSDGHCTGEATEFTQDNMDVLNLRWSDWRLPVVDELVSLIEVRCVMPAINETIFPDTPNSLFSFWSASAIDNKHSWQVSDALGDLRGTAWTWGYVRLVKGEKWFDPLKTEERKQAYFTEQKKNAPDTWRSTLRELSKVNFCVLYGEFIKGNPLDSNGYLSEDIAFKLVNTEARRRKLRFNDKQIQSEEVKIGMTECQLYATWGLPDDQNRTVGSWGVHIQHIYGSKYIYTQNGRVTSWQD